MITARERVRKELAKRLWGHQCHLGNIGFLSHKLATHRWDRLSKEVQKTYLSRADRILAIEGLVVLDDDQELPQISDKTIEGRSAIKVLKIMVAKGWRKVEAKDV